MSQDYSKCWKWSFILAGKKFKRSSYRSVSKPESAMGFYGNKETVRKLVTISRKMFFFECRPEGVRFRGLS